MIGQVAGVIIVQVTIVTAITATEIMGTAMTGGGNRIAPDILPSRESRRNWASLDHLAAAPLCLCRATPAMIKSLVNGPHLSCGFFIFSRTNRMRMMMHFLTRSHVSTVAMVAGLSLAFVGAPAQAQEEPKDHVILGAGASYMPAYQGADSYIVMPLPAVDVTWGPAFVNLRNGLGIAVIDSDIITLGASVMPMQGYRRKDAPDGIGKLSVSAGGRLFVTLKAKGFIATIGGTKGFLGDSKGIIADASLSYPVRISSRLTLTPTVASTWTDRKYNNRYFGVNAEQSIASGLPEFETGSGIKDVSAMLSVNYRLTDHISLGATGGMTSLIGKVKDSPIVFHKTQPQGFLSLSYRF